MCVRTYTLGACTGLLGVGGVGTPSESLKAETSPGCVGGSVAQGRVHGDAAGLAGFEGGETGATSPGRGQPPGARKVRKQRDRKLKDPCQAAV